MKTLHLFLCISLALFASCTSKNEGRITRTVDYQAYLEASSPDTTSKYFRLWNSKIDEDSLQLTSFGNVAAEYERFFRETGKIRYLKLAERSLERAVSIAAIGKAGYHRALARNYIAQHRFKEGLEQAHAAHALGSGKEATQSLYFDLYMELGQYEKANAYLDSIKNFSSFGYLIRLAKWNDYKGDLETTIRLMEKASALAEESGNASLKEWSYANLADFYGHAGRIQDSYEHYLKTLALNASNAHAKKGIAWIAYSHDNDPEEAKRILSEVQKTHDSPDHDLMLAEIATLEGDEPARLKHLDAYAKKTSDPDYGIMYNIPTAVLQLEEVGNYDRGIALAEKEVQGRATPETYGLLAYALMQAGKSEEAKALVTREVIGKTHEPAVLLQAAEVLKGAGDTKVKDSLKEELIEASYELGPVTMKRVRRL